MITEQVHALIQSVAESFRLGMEAQGSEGLVALIDALPLVLQICSTLDAARFNRLLSAMFAAQQRKDYLFLADLLQYELAPMIDSNGHSQSLPQ